MQKPNYKNDIKALILDLDDTLWDATNLLVKKGQVAALKVMAKHGLPIKESDADKVREMLIKTYGNHLNLTEKAVEHFGLYRKDRKKAEKIRLIGHHKYHTVKMGRIKPFKDTIQTLKKLAEDKKILVMLSYGAAKQQDRKLKKLRIKKYFDRVVFDTTIGRSNKFFHIKGIIKWLGKKGIKKDEILLVGDKITSEIEAGKRLGLKTVRIKGGGRYSRLKPENRWQKPDHTVDRISKVVKIARISER